MSVKKHEIQCLCDETFSVEIEDEIDLKKIPSLVQDIFEGRFQSFPCPACKSTVKVEIEAHITHEDWNLRLDFHPLHELDSFLAKRLQTWTAANRVSFGYQEMAEKVKIFQDKLDDRAIEVLKFLFLEKRQDDAHVSLLYHGRTLEKLEFYVEGLKNDEIGLTAVQESFYNKILASLKNPPVEWKDFIVPPYISVKTLLRE